MSLNAHSSTAPLFFSHGFGAHWQTIIPHLKRTIKFHNHNHNATLHYLPTDDADQIPYLVWDSKILKPEKKELVILSHGLEGAATSGYNLETAAFLQARGMDVWAWYMRGCATEMNPGRLLYNSGFTPDLKTLVKHAALQGYERIFLIGFSVGGNITLKALGEGMPHVTAAVCFSSPLVLGDVANHLSESFGGFYMKRFLSSLKEKIEKKEAQYPGSQAIEKLTDCRNFYSFDDHFTAPMHGFSSAREYYEKSSSIHFLPNIQQPVKVISATNDPFLTPSCFPDPSIYRNLHFFYPNCGGHCGFGQGKQSMASMALDFFRQMTTLD